MQRRSLKFALAPAAIAAKYPLNVVVTGVPASCAACDSTAALKRPIVDPFLLARAGGFVEQVVDHHRHGGQVVEELVQPVTCVRESGFHRRLDRGEVVLRLSARIL